MLKILNVNSIKVKKNINKKCIEKLVGYHESLSLIYIHKGKGTTFVFK